MDIHEYTSFDGLGLAELVAKGDVTPKELAEAAHEAITAVDGRLNAVVEVYEDRIADQGPAVRGAGPFAGVPFLLKDVGGHEAGRKIEYGSRLCEGMVAQFDTNFAKLLRAAGLNIIGRTNAPEFSIAYSSENLIYGNTSTPWREGFSAGGSSGGSGAAVAAGIVPLAHGSDIGGSIRVPAAWCGGIGLKPSRGLVSAGPALDEGGMGLAMSFVQSRTMRDTAAMLDCLSVPQPGDPFVAQRPAQPFSTFLQPGPEKLRIAWSADAGADRPFDPEIRTATVNVAKTLEGMGHTVEEAPLPFAFEAATRAMTSFWFFGFQKRINHYASRTGRAVGPGTLEPIVLEIYHRSREIGPDQFLDAWECFNAARRSLGEFFATYDVFLSPTTATTSPPHGPYGLNHAGRDPFDYCVEADKVAPYSFPFNVSGGPSLSLPLATHSNGLPIGIQISSRPAADQILIALGASLEAALPWADRVPPLHVSHQRR